MLGLWALAVALAVLTYPVQAYEKDMTVSVAAGHTECYYQHADAGHQIDIEYQVIDGSHGELDISFQMSEPRGRVLVADYKKPENSHRHLATVAGDYRFCFDNTHSTFSTKTVFFDLVVDSESEDVSDYDDEKEMELHGGADGAESYMMRVGDIMETVVRVRENIGKARRLQEQVSAHEARDRNLAEENNASVLRLSAAQLLLMLLVGVTQVYFLKSLFEQKQTGLAHFLLHGFR